MDWTKLNDPKVFFITGLSANSVLLKNPVAKELIQKVKRQYDLLHHPVKEEALKGTSLERVSLLTVCESLLLSAVCP